MACANRSFIWPEYLLINNLFCVGRLNPRLDKASTLPQRQLGLLRVNIYTETNWIRLEKTTVVEERRRARVKKSQENLVKSVLSGYLR